MDTFSNILTRAENPVAVAMVLILAWAAASDGEISKDEMTGLRSIAAAGIGEASLAIIVKVAMSGSIPDLQLACEVLKEIQPSHRRPMLQMTIGMALEDGYLTTGEGHIVRFVADLLQQGPQDLDDLFREMTGEAFPKAADPSSITWWESRERRNGSRESTNADTNADAPPQPPRTSTSPDMSRLRDLAALGLDDSASDSEIREAYRRMAKVHHPDKFSELGTEAVKAAEISFRRIREAYGRLVSS